MKKQDKIAMLLISVMVIMIISLPLFGNTLFAVDGHDTFFHTQRIVSIKNALLSGQFPVRIYKEIFDGYGYGASMFYPDLFLYIPAFMHMLGLPLTASYNLFLIMVNAATLFLAYYSFSKITDSPEIGLIAAVLYELCTYRMIDLYTRSSIGEVLALAFCPLVLCGLHEISRKKYSKWWILSLAFSGLLQSHILTFAMMVLVAVCYVLIRFPSFFCKKAIFALGMATACAILMNLWFLVPFLIASGLEVVAFKGADFYVGTSVTFVQLFDFLALSAGGVERVGEPMNDEMTLTPGITLVLGIFLTIYVLLLYKEQLCSCYKLVIGYLSAGVAAVWMTTEFFPWELIAKVPVLNNFFSKYQFVWRFNVISVVFLSVAVAYGIYHLFVHQSEDKRKGMFLIAVVLCGCSILYINQFIKQSTQYGNAMVEQKGYMDRLYVVSDFGYTEDRDDITSNISDMQYSDVMRENSEISFHYKTETGTYQIEENQDSNQAYLEVPITYYPGYKVLINGMEAEQECSDWGIIRIILPEGVMEGDVEVYFKEPVMWRIMEVVSIMSCIGMCLYVIYHHKKEHKCLEVI